MVMVTSWHDYPAGITGRTEAHLLNWFARHSRQGETWLDIGAHYGYTSLALSRSVGSAGRVFSFEPFVASAGYLSTTRGLNRLTQMRVIPIALGSKPPLHANRMAEVRGMLDSSRRPDGDGELYFEAALDWLWPLISEGNARVDGVKIDVQGMEISVIEGMKEILRTWRPKLALEFHHGVDRNRVLSLLEDAGYRLPGTAIEPEPGEMCAVYLDDRSYAFTAPSIGAIHSKRVDESRPLSVPPRA